MNGSVNAQNSTAATYFQYTTDPAFTPTNSANIGSGFISLKGVAVDPSGDVFVADTSNNAVKEILTNGTTVPIGSGFSSPYAVAVDTVGDVFVADFGSNAVKEILRSGVTVTPGSGFSGPGRVAVDSSGDVFVADSGHNAIKEILPNGTIVTIASGFNNPQELAVDPNGDLIVADYGDNLIKEVLPSGAILSFDYSFSGPAGVAVNGAGDIFIADTNNNAVKELLPGGTIKTLGSGFALPIGIAVDVLGDVFVGDYGHSRVVKLSPPGLSSFPNSVSGNTNTSTTTTPSLPTAGTMYYYRAIGQGGGGTVAGVIDSFILAPAANSGVTPVTVSSLTLGTGANSILGTATATSDRTVLILSTLTLTGGQLDLGGNDLIVHNTGSVTPAQSLTSITAAIQSGYNGGTWTGLGLTSSAAQSNSTHLTTLGVIPVTTAGSFDNQSVTTSDVLVKYTYYGDANLDGRVDGSDYSRIDNGYLSHSAGWFNGDFNYDGAIDGSDYTLIDNAFNTQGARIAATIAAAPANRAAQFSTVPINAQSAPNADSNDWLSDQRKKQKTLFL